MSDKIPLPLILYPKKRVHWVLIVFYIFWRYYLVWDFGLPKMNFLSEFYLVFYF
ncbi:hypothetical protein [Moraxella bovis]|uniref:hypothetical protein n=1 Tax=Moraxella bovis TaxID=476 RepID=UPI0022263CD1|nr:hypothetical protein [Moraxella bovis]